VGHAAAGKPLAAPYPEIVSSWLRNGFSEVGAKQEEVDDGIPERLDCAYLFVDSVDCAVSSNEVDITSEAVCPKRRPLGDAYKTAFLTGRSTPRWPCAAGSTR